MTRSASFVSVAADDLSSMTSSKALAAGRRRPLAPQDAIDDFWTKFTTKTPGKARTIIPQNRYAQRVVKNRPSEVLLALNTQTSYEEAAAMCRAKVSKIVKECRRINKKYRDPHFDLETDLKLNRRDTLESLASFEEGNTPGHDFSPQSAKRVADIFDEPQFYIDGPTANDVRQGRDGDCWLMAALCTLSNKPGLIERLCVAHDQEVGVYGFVFHRDGEWISEIVDDFLYLTKPDYDESYLDRVLFDELERSNPEETYRKIYQMNSSSLYFAQCQHQRETWLPLLEKCFAKAHGDYAAIEGGFGGEGIEDLTGGVTSELFVSDILDRERFWRDDLLKVNDDFLFGCSTGVWGLNRGDSKGIVDRHAYSIQRAVEIDGKRLLRLKNPWGKGEWRGAWSDGSKEWTPEWLQKLDHQFGDDGNFWIAYEDLLRKYQVFDRTRLFGPEWRVAQAWATFVVSWNPDYHDVYFKLSIDKPGPVVVVLSQLDDRYFRGLAGQYKFDIGFRLHKTGHEDYLVRSQTPYRMKRSVNVELELDQGDYEVRVKIGATRDERLMPLDQVVRKCAKVRRDKLIRIGLAYDLAHSKGIEVESKEENVAREAYEQEEKKKVMKELKEKILAEREQEYYLKKKRHQREKGRLAKRKEKRLLKKEERELLPAKEDTDVVDNGGPNDDPLDTGEMFQQHDSDFRQTRSDVLTHHYHDTDDELESLESLSDLSERELEIQAAQHQQGTQQDDHEKAQPGDEPELDEFERDPWNAVAVLGLRVYHKGLQGDEKGDALSIKVVRPNPHRKALPPQDDKEQEVKGKGLDVDDSAKDATLEGDVNERKESIIGDQKRVDE